MWLSLVGRVRKLFENKNVGLSVVIGLFIIAGTLFTLISRAATDSIAVEPENGAVTCGASVTTDAGASDGQAVSFGTCDGRYSFESSGLTGGGFQNVMAISPFTDANGKRPYLLGADVSGVHRSFDKAVTWKPVPSPGHVATVLWSDSVHGKAYVGADEGLFMSTNWGATWSRRPGAVNFDANGTYFVSGEHPRPTGNLIAQETSGATKYLWVATATQGVKQSTDDGGSWNATVLSGDHLRSLVADPNDPDVLYVAIRNTGTTASRNGIWRSTNARSATMSFTKMSGLATTTPEELWAIDDGGSTKLYAASAESGVFMYNGTTWAAKNSGLDTGSAGSTYESITGYKSGSNIVLYAGATSAAGSGAHNRAIMKSTDGGGSWTSVSDDAHATVDWHEYGTQTLSWLRDISYHNFAGNPAWTAAYLAIDPDATNNILVAGRGGVWVGAQGALVTRWQPGNQGLMVTVNMSVATDPAVAGRVVDGSMDYRYVQSSDGGNTFTRGNIPIPVTSPPQCLDAQGHPNDCITTGDVVIFDANPGPANATPVYIGASQRGQNTGHGVVFSNPDPFGGGAWVNENLPVSGDVPALGVGHDGNGTRIILASVSQHGFYRKAGGTWSPITGGPFAGSSATGSFAWKPGTAIVYAIDGSGVWRSNTAGTQGSWVKISGETAAYGELNALALDPVNPNYLYVSRGSIKRITNAETSTGIAATNSSSISGVTDAGPIAVSRDGKLFVDDRGGKRIFRSANPRAASPAFVSVSDQFFAENGGNIRSMTIGVDDRIYTADNGAGLMVGIPQ